MTHLGKISEVTKGLPIGPEPDTDDLPQFVG
jgi:hypothetical protein